MIDQTPVRAALKSKQRKLPSCGSAHVTQPCVHRLKIEVKNYLRFSNDSARFSRQSYKRLYSNKVAIPFDFFFRLRARKQTKWKRTPLVVSFACCRTQPFNGLRYIFVNIQFAFWRTHIRLQYIRHNSSINNKIENRNFDWLCLIFTAVFSLTHNDRPNFWVIKISTGVKILVHKVKIVMWIWIASLCFVRSCQKQFSVQLST